MDCAESSWTQEADLLTQVSRNEGLRWLLDVPMIAERIEEMVDRVLTYDERRDLKVMRRFPSKRIDDQGIDILGHKCADAAMMQASEATMFWWYMTTGCTRLSGRRRCLLLIAMVMGP